MRMFPCPDTGSYRRLFERTVRLFHCIDQGYIAVVFLHRLIQKFEDTLCSCQCHDNRVKLLGHLGNRHVKASCQLQEGSQRSKGQSPYTVNGHYGTNRQSDDIVDISKVGHHRHKDICVNIRIFCTVKQSVVEFIKFLLRLFLMAEYLDHLLAFHHLFDISVQNSQILLLAYKVFSTLGTKITHNFNHNGNHDNDEHGQRNAQHQHGDKGTHNGNHGAQHLRNTLTDHLTQRVRIVGITAHDITMRMGIKIFNRQTFHMSKHVVTDPFQGSLGHIHHQSCIKKRSKCSDIINTCHHNQCPYKRCKAWITLGKERQNIIINQIFDKQITGNACQGTDCDSHCHQNAVNSVILPYISEQAHQGLTRILAAASIHVLLIHSDLLLSAVICKYPGKSRWSSGVLHEFPYRRFCPGPEPESDLPLPQRKSSGQ